MNGVAEASVEIFAVSEGFSTSIEEINASVAENTIRAQEISAVVRRLNELVGQYEVRVEQEMMVAPDVSPVARALPSRIKVEW
jgi:methyl-accepting chemotaxis protein